VQTLLALIPQVLRFRVTRFDQFFNFCAGGRSKLSLNDN
jgi:hypothetical protein